MAREFVTGLAVPVGGVWVDVGCGSCALTDAILASSAPAKICAVDRSVDFVLQSRNAISDGRVMVAAGDAVALPFHDEKADAVVSGLVLNFVAEPKRAVREMLRCVRAGGVVATYLWDYAGGMQVIRLFWDAALALDPSVVALDEAERFPVCQPEALEELFRGAGAGEVGVTSISVETRFDDFDDLWAPFLGGQGPAPAYAMSLPENHRDELREALRNRVPVRPDGSIKLNAKAWVAYGRRRRS